MDANFKGLRGQFQRMLVLDSAQLGRGRRILLYFPKVLSYAVLHAYRDSVTIMAAALAYTTILSIVPVMALAVLYTKFAGKIDDVASSIQGWVFRSFVAESAMGITSYIDGFVQNLHTKTLGTVGVLGLLFTAYTMLASVEKSLNRIWKAQRHRSVLNRFQMLCSLLIVVPSFLTASFFLSGKLNVSADPGAWLLLVPLMFTALSLFFVFKVVPHTYVQWRAAAAAALIAALLFEAGKIGFNFYVTRLVSWSKIYGSLGLFPVILIWIYLSWTIVLFGAEIGYCLQNLRSLEKEAVEKETTRRPAWIHDEWGLAVAVAIAQRFSSGSGPVTMDNLVHDVAIDSETLRLHLDVLTQEGFLAEVGDEPAYLLTQDAAHIRATDVRNAFRKRLTLATLKTGPKTLAELQTREAIRAGAGNGGCS